MDNKVQKRKRAGSLQVTFEARKQGKENHDVRTRRRVKIMGKGDRDGGGVVSSRPPVWQDPSKSRNDVKEGDVPVRPATFTRRSRRHAVLAQRLRTNRPVSTRASASNQKDAPVGGASNVVVEASKADEVGKLLNESSMTMVLRERNAMPCKASIPKKKRHTRLLHHTSSVPLETVSKTFDDTMIDLAKHVDGELSMRETDVDMTEEWSDEPYATEILKYWKDREAQFSLGIDSPLCCLPAHRLILVDWLTDVQNHLGLAVETLHLGVAMTDVYLRRCDVCLDYLQLVGIACLFVACKYEEIYLPDLKTLCSLCASIYTPRQLLSMERKVLRVLDFNVGPTSISFLKFFLSLNGLDDDKLELTCHYLLELMLLDYDVQLSLPSLRAAAALHLGRLVVAKSDHNLRGLLKVERGEGRGTGGDRGSGRGDDRDGGGCGCRPSTVRHFPNAGSASAAAEDDDADDGWTWKLVLMTGHLETELEPIVRSTVTTLITIPTAAHKAVFNKYCERRYMYVSLQPALADPALLAKVADSSTR